MLRDFSHSNIIEFCLLGFIMYCLRFLHHGGCSCNPFSFSRFHTTLGGIRASFSSTTTIMLQDSLDHFGACLDHVDAHGDHMECLLQEFSPRLGSSCYFKRFMHQIYSREMHILDDSDVCAVSLSSLNYQVYENWDRSTQYRHQIYVRTLPVDVAKPKHSEN